MRNGLSNRFAQNNMISTKNIILLVASTAVFFEALDIAIINLAMPIIQKEFSIPASDVHWAQTLYILLYGGFLIAGGKLSDLFGRKRIFIIGAALFLITSLGAGLSNEFYLLVAFRGLQGFAAALLMPAALSIITTTFTDHQERSRAIGIFSSFAAIGSGCGLSLGGVIATVVGWQWIFFINVPVIAVTLWAGSVYIKRDESSNEREIPDFISGLLLTGILLMFSFLIHVIDSIQSSGMLFFSLVTGIILSLFLLVQRSRKQKIQLIDKAILVNAPTQMSVGVTLLMGAFFTGYLFLISLTFQSGMRYSPATTGLLLFPFSILSAATGKFLMPFLLGRFSVKQAALLGMTFMFLGGLLLLVSINTNYPLIVVLLSVACVTGLGIAISFTSLMVMSVQSIRPEQHGVTTGLVSTAYFLGGGLGLSLLAVFLPPAPSGLEINQVAVLILTLYAVMGVALLLGVFKIYAKAQSAIGVIRN